MNGIDADWMIDIINKESTNNFFKSPSSSKYQQWEVLQCKNFVLISMFQVSVIQVSISILMTLTFASYISTKIYVHVYGKHFTVTCYFYFYF